MTHSPGPVETLARYCIQLASDQYEHDPTFRDAVDDVLGDPVFDSGPALLEAVEKAQEDINWMLNNQKFLNPHVFDYLDHAIARAILK